MSTLHSQDHGHLNDPETEVTVTFPFIEQLTEVQGCFVTHRGSSAGGKPYTEPEHKSVCQLTNLCLTLNSSITLSGL